MIEGLDHLGIAVDDLEASVARFRDLFGLAPAGMETVRDQGVRVAFLPLQGSRLELLSPTGPDTPVGRFLERRGPGLHHVCFRVDDLVAELERLAARGIRLIDRQPRAGAEGAQVAFLHPSATGGVLVELRQAGAGAQR